MQDVVQLMRQFAEMPEQAPESQQLREQLVTRRAEVLNIFHFGDITVHLLAASTLARIDPSQAETVLPTLIEGLQSVYEPNRVVATIGCKALGPLASSAMDALIGVLEIEGDTNLFSCGRAIAALKAIGPAASGAIPTLIRMLHGENSTLRILAATAAADALPSLGAEAAIPDLRQCLDLSDDGLRLAAAKAIWKLSGDVETALRVAREMLDHPDVSIRLDAVDLLGEIGPDARFLLRELQRLLDAKGDDERIEYLRQRIEAVMAAIMAQ